MKHDDASLAQNRAADPQASTWLSANAGSGKTRVLTDRVARLLIDGVSPQHILCLTYTKAAASEMQNRLFARLGEWAMMPDTALRQSLEALGLDPETLRPDLIRSSRRLFAKAIETPGGLKIQTIHSFCAALLRRFPLEAGVSPAFREIDERSAKLLRSEVLERIALRAPKIMAELAAHVTGDEIDKLLAAILRNRELFDTAPSDADLARAVGLPSPGITADQVLARVFKGDEAQIMARIIPLLETGTKTDAELASKLAALDFSTPGLALLADLEPMFLFGEKTANPYSSQGKKPPNKGLTDAHGADFAPFFALRERVEVTRDLRLSYMSFRKSKALHEFAAVFLPALEEAKRARGWLDFDDLILRARALLSDPDVSAWVLFRLDGGIDHLLVDEAQDTSPAQWDVVRLLTEEFTAGAGARPDVPRTIFVVGDQKQSIYSFQGADPDGFERMREHFETELDRIGIGLQKHDLLHSFRSAAPVLELVDKTFTPELLRGMGGPLVHYSFKNTMPGRVDLWPWIEVSDKEDDKPWFDPVDTVGTNHHSVQLAEKLADFIADRLAHGQITTVTRQDGTDIVQTRRIRPSDFLILVQRRSTLFHAIIRACKNRNLPLAGADRLKIGAELGVRDLTALLSYLATPEDDLSLACVLRSPLGGLSEAELFDLAHDRGRTYLRQRLEAARDRFPVVHAMLKDLRDQADYLRPFELIERALTRHRGREKMVARLGPEAEEGIAALLEQALAYETTDVPSLSGFLNWLESDEVEIKRQIETGANLIRVMTVHGAKGLEAPIVLLPDTLPPVNKSQDAILPADGIALWRQVRAQETAAERAIREACDMRQTEERRRLLYVAMTRAESWLIVCGTGNLKSDREAWYELIDKGLVHAGAVPGAEPGALCLGGADWPSDLADAPLPMSESRSWPVLPDWADVAVAAPVRRSDPVAPSDLGGDKVLPGSPSSEDALERGTAIHSLLEILPTLVRNTWPEIARRVAENHPGVDADDILAEVTPILDAPALRFLFSGDALAEVPFSASLDALEGRPLRGQIDRLVIAQDHVLAVDFKSNALVPETPETVPSGLLRQMAAYRAALDILYPGQDIRTAILWTKTAQLMHLPHEIVRDVLTGPIHLDGSGQST